MLKLIGLSGRKRSGKDSIGQYLEREHGYTIDYFAKPLKEAVRNIFHWSKAHTDGPMDKSEPDLKEAVDEFWGKSPRLVMQLFGTEVGRQIDVEVWVKSLQLRVQQGLDSGAVKYAITDVRFENEAEIIKKLGGEVWRVERPGLPASGDLHPSETSLDSYQHFDHVIVNDGTLDDLYRKVSAALKDRP